ncbi:unnamed protein product [Prorocentrum cordatum]|uniref:Uncharacterized protein n=1 Tax=Prorocentrum cordatum TaxID=2364126 RepID=A0ABN9VBA8_9DINO|nr:unnamed protein product [Polarella glacialis]
MGMLAAVRQLGWSLWSAQKIVPGLRQMCEHYDAELFLVVPSLVCLSVFSDPRGPLETFATAFLPHHLAAPPPGDGARQLPSKVGAVVADLQRTLATVVSCLMVGETASGEERSVDFQAAAWEVLVRRSVAGACRRLGAEDPYADLEQPWRAAAEASVEGFMNRLEGWSMQLQRHRPDAWNELSGLLVQCIQWHPHTACRAPPKFAI